MPNLNSMTFPSNDELLRERKQVTDPNTGNYNIPGIMRPGKLQLKTKVLVRKFTDKEAQERNEPYEVIASEGNMGCNLGIQKAWDMICGGTSAASTFGAATVAPIPLSTTYSFIGVGADNAAESATATGLVGYSTSTSATQCEYHAMDATTYPQRTNQTMSWKSTFGSTEANFSWNEFTIQTGTYTGDATSRNLIRKMAVNGTKASGQSWEATIAITLS